MGKKKNIFNTFWKMIHFRNLMFSIIIGAILLYINDQYWPKQKFVEEFIIVFIAAFAVSAYFEFFLRSGISEENMKFWEMKEELGKAGVIKYYSNFKDVDLLSMLKENIKYLEIYVNFGDTLFNQLADVLEKFCRKEGNVLNIFILSPKNKFIPGLGELWGADDAKYNADGILAKIESSQQTLKSIFNQLEMEKSLKARVKVFQLKRNPVFYSFYRFDDTIIYVPSKISTPRTIIPPAFLIQNTHDSVGMYSKCMQELEIIKQDEKWLDIFFKN